ncbi:MAG: histidine phosphatase family protein [Candidatus Velthaea sp.]
MRVYVARHGETTWNMAGRYQGRLESGLSALGVRQGFALAEAFAHMSPRIERVISSPLLRTSATAKFVGERLNLAVEHDDRLLEIAHGTWEGRLRDEIAADDPDRMRAWKDRPATVVFEGGEMLAHVDARWRAFMSALNPDAPALVVTHDAVVRIAILAAQQRPLDDLWKVAVENAGFAVFESTPAGWTLIDESVTAHLDGVRATTESQAL